MKPKFLTIDLDIYTRKAPKAILADLGDDVHVLYSDDTGDGYLTAMEASWYPCTTPRSNMRAFRKILAKLSARGRKEWDEATKRIFDFGYEFKQTPPKTKIELPADVIAMVHDLGGTVCITVYNRAAPDL